MTAKITPCKYCKRGKMKIHHSNKLGHQIVADKCAYCDGKGWIRVEDKEKEKQNADSNI